MPFISFISIIFIILIEYFCLLSYLVTYLLKRFLEGSSPLKNKNCVLLLTSLTANAISMDISTIRGRFFDYPWTVLFRDPKESKMLYPWTPSSTLALSKDMLSMDIAKKNFHIIVQLAQTLLNST